MRWAEFERVGVFQYSVEEGTRSGEMDDALDEKTIAARHRKLMQVQRPISKQAQRRFGAREIEVLVDGVSDESEFLLEGRHHGQAPEIDGKVYLVNGAAQPGEIRRALVTDAADYDLVADLMTPDGSLAERPPGSRRIKLKTL